MTRWKCRGRRTAKRGRSLEQHRSGFVSRCVWKRGASRGIPAFKTLNMRLQGAAAGVPASTEFKSRQRALFQQPKNAAGREAELLGDRICTLKKVVSQFHAILIDLSHLF